MCEKISEGICEACKKELVYVKESYCMCCGCLLLDEQAEYCPNCKKKPHVFDRARSLFLYQGPVKKSMYRLKYGNRREYAAVFAEELGRHLGDWVLQQRITAIVPIPLHPSRRRSRGYNQAALLGRGLGKWLDLPVAENLLFRVQKTTPLKKLTGQQRREVLKKAFRVRADLPAGQRLLLIDDIYTTGSTADAAAAVLKEAGAEKVFVLCVAAGMANMAAPTEKKGLF